MATSLENNVSGGSDSDLDFSSAPEDIPSTVIPPEHDGLPQVGFLVGNCFSKCTVLCNVHVLYVWSINDQEVGSLLDTAI